MTHLAKLTLGYAFLTLGILGLFLPFLQGFLFLFIGLLILARHAPWAHRALERLKRTHPRAGALVESAEAIVDGWGDRLRNWRQGLWRRLAGR
jgi:uncharacterized membrane protein YbaN (DUF454 family)